MSDLVAQGGLFLSAFTSATLLPGTSEAALLALLASGRGEPGLLVTVATVGNVLGSLVNWLIGRFLSAYRDRRWFPVRAATYDRAVGWYGRYGAWSLLMSWLPVIGDPLTVIAGALRVDFLRFVVLVSVGKGARYAFVAAAFLWWSQG